LKHLSHNDIGREVWLRGRVHKQNDVSTNLCFLFLRYKYYIIQCIVTRPSEKELIKFCSKISNESVIDIYGTIVQSEVPVTGATFSDIEVKVSKCFVVSEAIPQLPLQIEDAARPVEILNQQQREIDEIDSQIERVKEELKTENDANKKHELEESLQKLAEQKSVANKYASVDQSVRLDNRVIDIRTPANHALYKISSAFCAIFRQQLVKHDFIEIHTPKLLGTASEGGSEVFEVAYFDRKAYLAQSPQLYKQMSIVGDFGRVFEIGPVFRAEKSDTHRHLTEFVGIDLEMEFHQHYHEVLRFIGQLLVSIFDQIAEEYDEELNVINEQFPFERLVYPRETIIFKFPEVVQMIREAGGVQGDLDDLTTANERLLGKIIKERYNTDFYIVDKFPFKIRAFYSMPDPENPDYANAYDIFLRGEEISSGAQRVHVPEQLEQQARDRKIETEALRHYIDSFKYGSSPHAGCGLGLERIVMLYTNIGNVRKTSLFPRDPFRLSP